MKIRVFLPLILVAVTLAWVGSASAISISFIEPISPSPARLDPNSSSVEGSGIGARSKSDCVVVESDARPAKSTESANCGRPVSIKFT